MKVQRKNEAHWDTKLVWDVIDQSPNYYICRGVFGDHFSAPKADYEEFKERTYSIGQRLRICGATYIIGTPECNKISLINIDTGCRWGELKPVQNTRHITKAELNIIDPFTVVS